jgi:hypothetical protein
MATISFSGSLSVTDGGTVVVKGSGSETATQSGAQLLSNVQIIGTTTEALLLGDVTTIGWLYLENLDSTNFVRVGLATPVTSGDAFLTIPAGQFALVPTRQTTIYAIADTANVNLRVVAVEL